MHATSFTALALATLALTSAARAQFSIPCSTLHSGGWSTGGAFALHGTMGQADAAPALHGGSFALEPGFWHSVAIEQTPGAPLLKITLIPGPRAVLSWPVNTTGFKLEETSSLAPGGWSATVQAVMDTATEHTVVVPLAGVLKCYRLTHP